MIALPQPWPSNPWPTRFRTVRASDAALSEEIDFLTVCSPNLHGRGDMAVFVPPGLDHARDVPLVVLLHGVYGSFWNWAFNGGAHLALRDLLAAGEVDAMVLAMPSDGLVGEGTAYLPHPHADYERWILDDVPAAVSETVGCVSDRSPLMLGGNSMGGFGAIRLGVRGRQRVAAIAAHSPITHLDELAQFTETDVGVVAALDDSQRSLLGAIDTTSAAVDELPPIMIDCGTSDPLIEAGRALRDGLVARGIQLSYEEYEGGHDWSSWRDRIRYSLRFFGSQ